MAPGSLFGYNWSLNAIEMQVIDCTCLMEVCWRFLDVRFWPGILFEALLCAFYRR